MSGHTDVPWVVWDHPNPGFGCEIRTTDDVPIVIAEHVRPADAPLLKAAPELLEACAWFMKQLDDGVLVRDISGDGEPDWTMRMLRFTTRLSKAAAAIAKAEGSAD